MSLHIQIEPYLGRLPTMEFGDTYMSLMRNKRLVDFLQAVADPMTRDSLLAIYRSYEDVWPVAPGSSHTHQPWPGGLRDHLADMCRLGWLRYQTETALFGTLPFSFDDVVVCIFCHDAEKLVKGFERDDARFGHFIAMHGSGMTWENIKWELLAEWAFFGLVLTEQQTNALRYTHGEPDGEYRKDKRVMNELASFVHGLDNAHGYHDRGQGLG